MTAAISPNGHALRGLTLQSRDTQDSLRLSHLQQHFEVLFPAMSVASCLENKFSQSVQQPARKAARHRYGHSATSQLKP